MSKVHWVIDIFSIREGNPLLQILNDVGCKYTMFAHRDSVPPGYILGSDVFYYGDFENANWFKFNYKNWKPGVLYDASGYSFYNIAQHVPKKLLLNHDYGYRTVGYIKDNFEKIYRYYNKKGLFVRPNFPNKMFPAFSVHTFDPKLFWGQGDTVLAVVASHKEISEEYRLFVVGNEVVTGSSRKIGNHEVTNMRVPPDVLAFAKELAYKYKFDRAYAMDIAVLKSGERRLADINPLSCTPFLGADVEKIVLAINAMCRQNSG